MTKVAMVTGAGQGIGKAIAKRLAKAGFAVSVADLNSDNAQQVAKKIKDAGGDALAVTVNIADRDQMFSRRRITLAVSMFSSTMLAWVRSPGPRTSPRRCSIRSCTSTLPVICGEFRQLSSNSRRNHGMVRKSLARSLTLPRRLGCGGNKNELLYSSTKFAVRGLTQVAARDLAKQGITVNAYAPGIVDTPMMRKIADDQGLKMSDYESLIALDKLSDPDDVAKVVEFLASDKADYITGQTILCDGGMQFE